MSLQARQLTGQQEVGVLLSQREVIRCRGASVFNDAVRLRVRFSNSLMREEVVVRYVPKSIVYP